MLLSFNEADKQNPLVIKGILQRTKKLGSKTFTDRAIKTAGDEMFTAEGGERPGQQDVLLVLTDGQTNKNSQPYERVNQPLRVGIFIFTDYFKREYNRRSLPTTIPSAPLLLFSFRPRA